MRYLVRRKELITKLARFVSPIILATQIWSIPIIPEEELIIQRL